jgi:hypothetical protein
VLAGLETLWEKFCYGVYVHNNPFILIAVFLAILGVNFIVMGLLAELIVRTYHESQGKPIYHVRDMKNVDGAAFGGAGEPAARREAVAKGS